MMLRLKFNLVQRLQKIQGLRSIRPFSSAEKVSNTPSFVPATPDQIRNLNPQLDGIWHGQEDVRSPKGSYFDGSFLEGLYHDYGILREKDGSVYKGSFAKGAKNGEGCLIDSRGVQIKGIWVNNVLANEPARITTTKQNQSDTTTPKGPKKNKMDPTGSLLDSKNKTVDYEEKERGDNWNGEGVKVFPNGDKYEGEFLYGKPHGQGTKTYADGAVLQGEFRSGKICNGWGVVKYPDGSSKEGTFVNFKMEGHGKRTESSGEVYEGGFLNDLLHGDGVVRGANGLVQKVQMEHGVTLKSVPIEKLN